VVKQIDAIKKLLITSIMRLYFITTLCILICAHVNPLEHCFLQHFSITIVT